MTYEEAMAMECYCGYYPVGGWVGDRDNGSPRWAKIIDHAEGETHTVRACTRMVKRRIRAGVRRHDTTNA